MTVRIVNGKAVEDLTRLPEKLRIGLTEASHMAGAHLVRTAQQGILNGAKSGRIYGHPRGGTYQASAPGEYSANVTGRQLNAINYLARGRSAGGMTLHFYNNAPHGGFQELGTRKMAPRPNLGNAVRDTSGTIRNLLGQIVFRTISAPG